MLTAKQIDRIFKYYIKQAQGFCFVAENVAVDFDSIETYKDCEILTQSLMVSEVRFTQRLINAIERSGKITFDEAVKRGIADVPTELENRLICLELQKHFDLSQCPQFKNDLLQIEKRKDFLMPITKDGLITGIRFEYLPSKGQIRQGSYAQI